MSLRSVAARRASLMNDYGATHGPNSPASFEVALLMADPSEDYADDFDEDAPEVEQHVEVTPTTDIESDIDDTVTTVDNGYARVTVPNDGATFPEPDAEGVLTSAVITFPAALAEYPDTVVAVRLIDPSTGDVWDEVALPEDDRIDVTEAGTVPAVALSLFHSEADDDGFWA